MTIIWTAIVPDRAGTYNDAETALLRAQPSLTADTLTMADICWLQTWAETREDDAEHILRACRGVLEHPQHPDVYKCRLLLAQLLASLRANPVNPA